MQTLFHISRNGQPMGPWTIDAIIAKLGSLEIAATDFIYEEASASWVAILQFAPVMQSLHASRPLRAPPVALAAQDKVESAWPVQRKHPRFEFKSDVIAHDEQRAWTGESYQASEGGSGIIIRNAALQQGQIIRVHFAPEGGVPAFNATCEVVSKQAVPQAKGRTSPVPYSVKFLEIEDQVRIAVRRYYSSRRDPA